MSESTIKKIVYFVRHGESEGNVGDVFQPLDCPLTNRGREQAELIAARASNLSFDALIASPFQRAAETAETIAAATGKRVEYSDLFVERRKPTAVDGKPYADEEANKLWRAWEESLVTPGMRIADGENFHDLIDRATRALQYLLDRPERTILVVTHGYFLRTLMSLATLGDLVTPAITKEFHKGFVTQNTGITVFRYHDAFEEPSSWRIWTYNDHAHLG